MARRNRIPGISKAVTSTGQVRWRAVVDVGGPHERKQIRKTHATQQDAIDWRSETLARKRRGEIVEPSLLPLRDYAREWLDIRASRVRPNTMHGYRAAYQMVDVALGSLPLSQITPTRLERAYADMHGRYAPSTIRNAHRTLGAILRTAVRDGLIARNPAERVDPPGASPDARAVWSLDMTRQFLRSLDREGLDGSACSRFPDYLTGEPPAVGYANSSTADPYADIWRLILEVWLRNGEVRALTWRSVDLDRGLLHVTATVTRDAERKHVIARPKSDAGYRVLPLSTGMVERLRERRRSQQLRAMELGLGWSDERFIFPGKDGRLMHTDSLRWAFRLACERAGVPNITIHGMRHTGISIAYANGMWPKVISERAGHSSVRITESIYVHIDQEQHVRLADLMGELLA
jgi:integrase